MNALLCVKAEQAAVEVAPKFQYLDIKASASPWVKLDFNKDSYLFITDDIKHTCITIPRFNHRRGALCTIVNFNQVSS